MKRIPRFRMPLSWKALGEIISWSTGIRKAQFSSGGFFEKEFSGYIGMPYAVNVPSGSAGLYLILKYMGFKPGEEIILPALSYWAIPQIVQALGLRPVFVDISPLSFHLDISRIEERISRATRAVIPTHLYGEMCDMEPLNALARKKGLFVVEDCVQALGATYHGRMAGSLGDAAYFSFGITKTMPLFGGGVVVSSNKALIDGIRAELRAHRQMQQTAILKSALLAGMMKTATLPGFFDGILFPGICLGSAFGRDIIDDAFTEQKRLKDTFTDFQQQPEFLYEILGRASLAAFPGRVEQRKKNGRYLGQCIQANKDLKVPVFDEGCCYTSFPVRVIRREKVKRALLFRGVDATSGFMDVFDNSCVHAREAEREILHLPVYPSLTEQELAYIAESLAAVLHSEGLQ